MQMSIVSCIVEINCRVVYSSSHSSKKVQKPTEYSASNVSSKSRMQSWNVSDVWVAAYPNSSGWALTLNSQTLGGLHTDCMYHEAEYPILSQAQVSAFVTTGFFFLIGAKDGVPSM